LRSAGLSSSSSFLVPVGVVHGSREFVSPRNVPIGKADGVDTRPEARRQITISLKGDVQAGQTDRDVDDDHMDGLGVEDSIKAVVGGLGDDQAFDWNHSCQTIEDVSVVFGVYGLGFDDQA